jgi:hypothetical protein
MMRAIALVPLIAAIGLFAGANQSSAVAPAVSAVLVGDVNCDSQFTAADALTYLTVISGSQEPTSCFDLAGDFTCDDNEDEADLIEALYRLSGLQRASCGGGPPNTLDLLGTAVINGDITQETADLYGVFAAFNDPRLPGEYAGKDPPELEPLVDLTLIASQLGTYSPDIRALLEPFLIPPMHAGSWWDLKHGGSASAHPAEAGPILSEEWSSIDTDVANVKLWFVVGDIDGQQLATSVKQEIDSHIWPQLTALMGRTPLPDQGSTTSGRGGDDRIDIGISNDLDVFTTLGLAPNWCESTPATIFADPGLAADLGVPFDIAIAHELMHTILFSYPLAEQAGGDGGCADAGYAWAQEATATWTEDFLYPEVNTEHTGIRGGANVQTFMDTLSRSLDYDGDSFRGINLGRPYGAYLFFSFAARKHGNDVIRQIWENFGGAGAIPAINSALPEGFDKDWPEFAVEIFNTPGFNDFLQSDHVDQKPDYQFGTYHDRDRILVPTPYSSDRWEFFEQRDLERISLTAHSWYFDADSVRTVTFHNGWAYNIKDMEEASLGHWFQGEYRDTEEIRGLKVQALIKINDTWHLEDWTDFPGRTFCRDKADERLQEIVIIASNSVPEKDYLIKKPENAEISLYSASDIACWRWEGTITNRYFDDSDGFEEKIVLKDAVVEAVPYYEYTGIINFQYRLVQGSIDWDYNWAPGECVYHGSERGMQVTDLPSFGTYNGVIEGPYHRAADASFNAENDGQVTLTCPDDPPETFDEGVGASFPHDLMPFVLEDGAIIDGSFNLASAPGMVGVEASWHFEAQRE